jgi:membrane associated rhomboid family serine protease
MVPIEVSAGQDLWTLVSSTFLHAGWMHLLGNMLFLWIFGDNLEEALGWVGFLAFYLLGGIGAGLCQWAADPLSPVPTIGASGAIAAVMGGYLLLFPKARIDVLIFIVILIRIIPVPAWIVLVVWLAIQVFSGYGTDPLSGGVAYWAHAGGFLVGFVMMVPTWVRRGGTGWWRRTDGQPPHPDASYGALTPSRIPQVKRRR